MIYHIPQQYTCPKCGHSINYSKSSVGYGIPVIDNTPVCPNCWKDFILSVAPLMVLEKGK